MGYGLGMDRRSFVRGLAGASLTAFAAPAIVRAANLMAIKPWENEILFLNGTRIYFDETATRQYLLSSLYTQIYRVDPLLQALLKSA